MRSFFFVVAIIINVYYFRKSSYLTDYQLYSSGIFFAAILYMIGEVFRSIAISKGKLRDFSFTYITLSLLSPFFRLFADPILVARSLIRKDKEGLVNLLHFRFVETTFLLSLSLFNLDLYRNELFRYLSYGAGLYLLVTLITLLINKTQLLDLRVVLYNFVIIIFQLSAFSIITFEYQGLWKPEQYLSQYYPFIIPEMKVSFFCQFIMGVILLSLFNFDSEKQRENSES